MSILYIYCKKQLIMPMIIARSKKNQEILVLPLRRKKISGEVGNEQDGKK